SGHGKNYMIVVLSDDNPTMAYGVDTVQDIAEVINHALNPGAASVIPAATPRRAPPSPTGASRPTRAGTRTSTRSRIGASTRMATCSPPCAGSPHGTGARGSIWAAE